MCFPLSTYFSKNTPAFLNNVSPLPLTDSNAFMSSASVRQMKKPMPPPPPVAFSLWMGKEKDFSGVSRAKLEMHDSHDWQTDPSRFCQCLLCVLEKPCSRNHWNTSLDSQLSSAMLQAEFDDYFR